MQATTPATSRNIPTVAATDAAFTGAVAASPTYARLAFAEATISAPSIGTTSTFA